MMMLIADSGSTKTTWGLIRDRNEAVDTCETSGINPFYQNENAILKVLEKEFTLPASPNPLVYFYGAGCGSPESKAIVIRALGRFFHNASLFVESDLMGAARALCQHGPGMACIMGTGSNSCFYDGTHIAYHVPSLGYILGDEGSGADIGRRLVSDMLKKLLPDRISALFYETYQLTPDQIQEHVYKNPFPNRFLARFTPFVATNLHESALYELVKKCFRNYFVRNIHQYPMAATQPIHFTGSIAFYFREILVASARENGYTVGIIEQNPMERLIQFHKV
jgi:N-acetylglucosamine kinase-like BadF-type ATPase